MAKSLQEGNNMRQQLTAMITHDLRTPLTTVMGFVDATLSETYNAEQKQKFGLMAQQNIQRVMNLINDLLDIEKLESGTFRLSKSPADLQDILKDSCGSVQHLADKAKVEIVRADCNYEIDGDSERLIQVFVNLLSNAIKFAPANSKINIFGTTRNGMVEISVQDAGRGIPAEQHDLIFQRYKQLQSDDGRRGRGTGLGLAIARAIVEQHAGEIGLESEVDRGSRFWVRLPLIRGH
jgi:signal transduction histidine kinase